MNVAMKNSPFQREVREWQRIDPNTGALLSGRLEADRWNNGSANKYGKVVDSQNISTPNGMHLQQRKELEVLQTRTDAGSFQVVRSSTIQTSSSRTKMPSSNNMAIEGAQLSPNYMAHRLSPQSQSYNKSNALLEKSSSRSSMLSGYDRGKSASTEDLSINYDNDQSDNDDTGPMEWRRVSKIRRSLQYPKAEAPRYGSRPKDLPENLVNISQIKRELQIGHRLNSPTSSFAKRNSIERNSVTSTQEFFAAANDPETKQIVKKASLINADSLQGIRNKLKRLSDESLYKDDMVTTPENPETNMKDTLQSTSIQAVQGGSHKIGSNATKTRESIPADWYLRRKSYGFEDMPSQADSAMSRMENSTDSGLGRSGEITSIWSASSTLQPDIDSKPRGTIITLSGQFDDDADLLKPIDGKRHSIAFDESKYVNDTKTLIHLNGLNGKEWNASSNNLLDENGRRSRRVEFCKTEVHFAAESGRVNIVETDGKPPSTNNFRRRRRTSSSNSSYADTSSTTTVATVPNLMHFGDEARKELVPFSGNTVDNEVKITVTEHAVSESNVVSSVVRQKEESVDELLDEISLRGILKNKPVKPRPYHLGENLENSERLWGIRLKPVGIFDNAAESDERDHGAHQAERMQSDDHHSKAVTRIKLNAVAMHYPWEEKDALFNQNQNAITASASAVDHDINNSAYPAIAKIPQEDSSKLKSTSLIMKTIKSANQFDEAMKNLTIFESTSRSSADNSRSESHLSHRVSQSPSHDSVSKNSSTSSIYSDGSIIKLNSVSNSSTSSSLSSMITNNSNHQMIPSKTVIEMTDRFDDLMHLNGAGKPVAAPIAAPRIKKIGSSTTGLSHQLSQLRRIYEAADQEFSTNDDDAVMDNEVKQFLANDTKIGESVEQPTNDLEATTELSGSWSRVRARRNIIKQYNKQHEENTVKAELSNFLSTGQNSNLMSITLHSPTETVKEIEFNEKPIAKPRTTNPIRTVTALATTHIQETSTSTVTNEAKHPDSFRQRDPIRKNNPNNNRDRPLFNKIDIRPVNGARKLKEHELSYFGLNVESTSTSVRRTADEPLSINNSKRNLEGKLFSDKPDLLLNHAPLTYVMNSKPLAAKIQAEKTIDTDIGPIYENIKPNQYERKLDLKKDEDNLRELNETADEINKYVFAEKEKPQRKSRSKPFDTIKEEDVGQQQKLMHSKAVQVSRGYNHTLHKIKPLHRTSSASSTESIISVGRTHRTRVSSSGEETRRLGMEKSNNERNSKSSSKSSRRHNASPSEAVQVIVGRASSRRRDNLSSRENSAEDVRAVYPAQHRSRRSTSGKVKPEVIRYDNSQASIHDSDRGSSTRRSTTSKSAGSTKVKTSGSTEQLAHRSRHPTPVSEPKAASSVKDPTAVPTTYVLHPPAHIVPPPRKKRKHRAQLDAGGGTVARYRSAASSSQFTGALARRKVKSKSKLFGACICA